MKTVGIDEKRPFCYYKNESPKLWKFYNMAKNQFYIETAFRPVLVELVYLRKGVVAAPKGVVGRREAFFVKLNNKANIKLI